MTSAVKFLEQRRKIRGDLVEWCRYAGREPAKHHRLILQHLADVATGKTDRLALCLPPGAGKSVYTQLFAAWWLANNPTSSIILAATPRIWLTVRASWFATWSRSTVRLWDRRRP